MTTNEENMEASGAPRSNPMFDLFYGKVKIEGKNQGNEFSREEQFGQWPLQVNSFSDIHESLGNSSIEKNPDLWKFPSGWGGGRAQYTRALLYIKKIY